MKEKSSTFYNGLTTIDLGPCLFNFHASFCSSMKVSFWGKARKDLPPTPFFRKEGSWKCVVLACSVSNQSLWHGFTMSGRRQIRTTKRDQYLSYKRANKGTHAPGVSSLAIEGWSYAYVKKMFLLSVFYRTELIIAFHCLFAYRDNLNNFKVGMDNDCHTNK